MGDIDEHKSLLTERPKQTLAPETADKDRWPWRYPDGWWWADVPDDIEDLITLEFVWGDHGTHEMTVCAPMDKLHPVLAKACDGAVDYVLAHPELYGLKKEQAE